MMLSLPEESLDVTLDADNSLHERARGAPPGVGLELPAEAPTKRKDVPADQPSPDAVDVSVDALLRPAVESTGVSSSYTTPRFIHKRALLSTYTSANSPPPSHRVT